MTYSLTEEQENKEIAKRYKDLLKGAYQSFTASDKKEIRKAHLADDAGDLPGVLLGPAQEAGVAVPATIARLSRR